MTFGALASKKDASSVRGELFQQAPTKRKQKEINQEKRKTGKAAP